MGFPLFESCAFLLDPQIIKYLQICSGLSVSETYLCSNVSLLLVEQETDQTKIGLSLE